MITCVGCKKIDKQCQKCKEYQKIYHASHRKEMSVYSARYYAKNREWILAKDIAKKKYNPDLYRRNRRMPILKNKYGITHEEFDSLLTEQENKCALCSNTFTEKMRPCVDHSHKTGKVRGLLCRGCNLILGHIEKSENYIQRTIQYLNKCEM